MQAVFTTHEVDNQPPPPGPFDLWSDDPALRDYLLRKVAGELVRVC